MQRISIVLSFILGITCITPPEGTAQQRPPANQEIQPTPRDHRPDDATDFNIQDAEIEKFARAAEKIESLREESREKQAELTEKYGISMSEYRQKVRYAEDPTRSHRITEEERDTLQAFEEEVMALQAEMDEKMQQYMEEADIDMQRYQQIISAMQRDEDLRRKVERKIN